MPIDFHARENRYTYSHRDTDPVWMGAIRSLVNPSGRRVVDVGCGGGIYSLAWQALGAAQVTGVDFSGEMVAAGQELAAGLHNVHFVQGDAAATGLPSGGSDVVFERALIHHLPAYDECFAEAHRLLVPGGMLLVQDRTPDDVNLPGSHEHLRGYFFDCFPRLRTVEAGRRPTQEAVSAAMTRCGFKHIRSLTLWETRRTYEGFDELAHDLEERKGRSILHELDDVELRALIEYIRGRMTVAAPIVEKDRWTIWSALR